MKIEVYIFVKNKPPFFYLEAIEEYQRRLGRYVSITYKIIRKKKEWLTLLHREGRGYILKEGATVSSEAFSREIGRLEVSGEKKLIFYICEGDWPMQPDERNLLPVFSVSNYTMTAPMQALVLYEQIYRAYRILHHHPYHK